MATKTIITEDQVAAAVREVLPYLKPGFADAWRKAGRVGYRNLGRALKGTAIAGTNGHAEVPTVKHVADHPKA